MKYIAILLSFAFTTIVYPQKNQDEIHYEILQSYLENEEKGKHIEFLMDNGLSKDELQKIFYILTQRELIKDEEWFPKKSEYVKTDYRTCKDIGNYRCSTLVSQPLHQLSVHQQVYQIMNKINSTYNGWSADAKGEEWYNWSSGFLVDTLRELIELWDDDEVYYTKYADRFRALDDCRLCQNREGE